jgi:hypothetical protein
LGSIDKNLAVSAIRALEAAGVEFIDQNGGGPGVRLRTPVKEKRGK